MRPKYFTLLLLSLGLLTSCLGEEPLNAECDIEAVSVGIDDPLTMFYHDYDTLQQVSSADDSICFIVHYDALVGTHPIRLTLTAGAQAFLLQDGQYNSFQNGSSVDFSNEQVRHFRIKSEDNAWYRDYKICFVHDEDPALGPCTMKIDFEEYALNSNGKYYVWTESDPYATSTDQWVSGNPGFNLSKSSAQPYEYPTVAVAEGGVDGGAYLKLETRDTGAFGRMVNMRIAAGNLFIGTFDVANALKDALAATQFGLPFKHKPSKLSGYYKWQPGEQFQDKKGNPIDRIDQPDIYCVFYRNQDTDGNRVTLDGADVLTNPHIIGLGRVSGIEETDQWTRFEIPVEYNEEIEGSVLLNNGYNLTICFASSIEGAYFEGAPGSTLLIDKVTLECEY